MTASAALPHDHPRVVAVSPALNASTRAALWPHGVSLARLEAMECRSGIKGPAPAPRLQQPAVSAPTKPVAAPPAPKAAQSQSYAVRYFGVSQRVGSPLDIAAKAVVDHFNRENSK